MSRQAAIWGLWASLVGVAAIIVVGAGWLIGVTWFAGVVFGALLQHGLETA